MTFMNRKSVFCTAVCATILLTGCSKDRNSLVRADIYPDTERGRAHLVAKATGDWRVDVEHLRVVFKIYDCKTDQIMETIYVKQAYFDNKSNISTLTSDEFVANKFSGLCARLHSLNMIFPARSNLVRIKLELR